LIVLDTHVWVWWNASPEKLSETARQAIDDADEIGVCPISCWELSMLVSKERIQLDQDVLAWIELALSEDLVRLIPISPSIAVTAGTLGDGFHGDPADRLIVATTIETGSQLVTKDRDIRTFQGVQTVW
jgi:PIN domain nuclease of toxin-antitoxin system